MVWVDVKSCVYEEENTESFCVLYRQGLRGKTLQHHWARDGGKSDVIVDYASKMVKAPRSVSATPITPHYPRHACHRVDQCTKLSQTPPSVQVNAFGSLRKVISCPVIDSGTMVEKVYVTYNEVWWIPKTGIQLSDSKGFRNPRG